MDTGARTLIHSVDIVESGRRVPDAWVLLHPSGVVATGQTTPWRDVADPRDTVIDAREIAGDGALLTPGFIDIHGHGGAGVAFDDGIEQIRKARRAHRRHGTTRAVVSLVTASVDELVERAAMVAELTGTDHDILGSHLEGPFLAAGHKGAHDPALLRSPAPDDVARLIAAAAGTLRQVTIAPELAGGADAIEAFRSAGVAVAVGHTDADAATAADAFEAGATILTHAFNGMNGIHHRAPGPVVAAASDPRVFLEIIADGIHVDLDLIRMIFAAAPGRVVLITDAMAAAAAGDGEYLIGALPVTVRNGIARLTHGDSIAGSTLTQDWALRAVTSAGVPIEDAVDALTRTPAAAIGLDDRFGTLRQGSNSDAVLLTADLQVRSVWADGVRV